MAEESKKFWLFFFEVFGGRTRKFLPRKLNETYAQNDRPVEATKSCGWKLRPLLAKYDSLFVGWSIHFGILKIIAINEEQPKFWVPKNFFSRRVCGTLGFFRSRSLLFTEYQTYYYQHLFFLLHRFAFISWVSSYWNSFIEWST